MQSCQASHPGVAEQHVTEEQQYRVGKQVNVAIAHGVTADSLAKKLAIALFAAQVLLDG